MKNKKDIRNWKLNDVMSETGSDIEKLILRNKSHRHSAFAKIIPISIRQ